MAPSNDITLPDIKDTGTGDLGKDEVLSILEDESSDPPVKEEEKDQVVEEEEEVKDKEEEEDDDEKKDDKDEDDEDKDEEEEDKKKDKEEELEIVVPARKKEILAKYPNLFKEFPSLERSYYTEQQYTEMFGTVGEAKEILERVKVLDRVEVEIFGNSSFSGVLKQVKDNDEDNFLRVVDNYLPSLMKVDERAYYHIIGNVIRSGISNMLREAGAAKDEDFKETLEKAAHIWNQFYFGSSEIVPPKNLSTPKDTKGEEKELKFQEEQLTRSAGELADRIDNVLKSTIDKHIDPNGNMTEYVKRQAVKDVMSAVEKSVRGDTRFQKIKDNLWKQSRQENFSRASLDKIKGAYLGYAKSILPNIIKGVRSDALRGLGRVKKEKEVVRRTSSSSNSQTNRGQKEIKRGMTTLDYLNSE